MDPILYWNEVALEANRVSHTNGSERTNWSHAKFSCTGNRALGDVRRLCRYRQGSS